MSINLIGSERNILDLLASIDNIGIEILGKLLDICDVEDGYYLVEELFGTFPAQFTTDSGNSVTPLRTHLGQQEHGSTHSND